MTQLEAAWWYTRQISIALDDPALGQFVVRQRPIGVKGYYEDFVDCGTIPCDVAAYCRMLDSRPKGQE